MIEYMLISQIQLEELSKEVADKVSSVSDNEQPRKSADTNVKQRQEMHALSVQHRSHIDEVWTREQSYIAQFVQELVTMTVSCLAVNPKNQAEPAQQDSATGRIQDVHMQVAQLSQVHVPCCGDRSRC